MVRCKCGSESYEEYEPEPKETRERRLGYGKDTTVVWLKCAKCGQVQEVSIERK